MAFRPSNFTTEQQVLLTTIVTTATLTMGYQSEFTGIRRVTSMGFTLVAATVGALVGVRLFGWPE